MNRLFCGLIVTFMSAIAVTYAISHSNSGVNQASVPIVTGRHNTSADRDGSNTVSLDAQEIYGMNPTKFGDSVEIVLPSDPDIVINIQDFGAVGDGKTDDTQTIQNAIYEAEQSNRALYFPNGTYRVTRELRFEAEKERGLRAGPHIYGQSRDGVILKLDDNAIGFDNPDKPIQAVIRTVHKDDGTTGRGISADQFNRFLTNFTVDTGNNPGAVGIKFYSNNTGILRNVRILGNGAVGLDLSSVALNGPHLVQNIEIAGFNIGVRAQGGFGLSSTLSNIMIRNAGSYGLFNRNQVLQVEGLTVENTPVAVFTSPTDRSDSTTLTLINGSFRGRELSQPAIINGDILFARNIKTEGYSKALQGKAGTGGNVDNAYIEEYSSHGVSKGFPDNTLEQSLNLPVRYSSLVYDSKPENWLSVKDYGAVPGDNIDDTAAIQLAIDAAAAASKTTVYFPSDASREPNWYNLTGEVKIHGSVNHIMGFAPARIIGDGSFKVIDSNRDRSTVQFQNFNFSKLTYDNASNRSMSLYNLTGLVKATGRGDVFLNSVAGQLSIKNPRATVWARQLNTESADINIVNNEGTLWLLGQKTEKGGIKASTLGGAKTEILGAQLYSLGKGSFDTVYEVIDSDASFAGIRENTNTRKYASFIKETRNQETSLFKEDEAPSGSKFKRAFSFYSAASSMNSAGMARGSIRVHLLALASELVINLSKP